MGQKITGNLEVTGTIKLGADTLTVSGAELNHVDGVTSAIQTQLDSKAVLANWGNPDGGYKFDGVDDCVIVSDNANLNFGTGNFSIEIMLYNDGVTSATVQTFLRKSGTSYYYIRKNASGNVCQFAFTDDAPHSAYTTFNLITGWNHIVISGTRTSNAIAYLNATSITTLNISALTGNISNTNPLTFGTTGSSEFFKGLITIIRVFNRALTQAEVTKLYNNGRPDLASLDYADLGASQTALYTSDFGTDENGWTGSHGTVAGNIDSIGAENDWLRFTINDQNITHFISYPFATLNKTIKVKFKYYLPSTNSNMTSFSIWGNAGSTQLLAGLNTTDAVTETEVTFTPTIAGIRIYAGNGGNLLDAGGDDVLYIKDFTITQLGCVAEYLPQNAGRTGWIETQNNLHGSTSGSPISLGAEQGIEKYKDIKLTVTDDTTITNAVPKGYILKSITVNNSTANAFTMNVGTTAGATDVVNGASIAVSGLTTITINKAFSTTANQTLYITDTGGWNSSSNNIHLIMEKL